jgi:hypothetical protein
MKMKSSKEILSSIMKTTQMGQVGIRAVIDIPMQPALRNALESQLQEYDAIEGEANNIASSRGWELPNVDPVVKGMSATMSRMRLSYGNAESKIAGMMIQGNTRGMILGLKNIHQLNQRDVAVCSLSQKLLDTEAANIRQMQSYL